ncbi:MAG TPA: signal recognition particle-docking protein FtsY [Geminicoccus sp.]|nr:signal recognition particle-docking protein FtsY [Geminicoccus sp.]HWL69196.1 signal recognition particle-docking protein FtsY [Geminicoccus sp.]
MREFPPAMTQPNPSWWQRLKSGLSKTSGQLTGSISTIFVKKKLDQETLDELEEALIVADMGVETAGRLVGHLKRERYGRDVSDREVRQVLAAEVARILKPYAKPIPSREVAPQVILICGVNGTGKTTTIGKLAKMATDAGLKVVLAACDTFRAAAVEQLQVWGERNGVPVYAATQGSDPAALAFSALEKAKAQGADILMIDTAGRLHNKAALMDELKKIVRVIKKVDPSAPHDTVLVLDGTTGQNAHRQVEVFRDIVDVSGLVVTKLDGTAKGGVVVSLAERFHLPIHALGVGEAIEDLKPFEAQAFADALLGLDQPEQAA